MWGIFDTVEEGPVTLHVGYQRRMAATRNNSTGITGEWIRNSDLSLGVMYDPGEWFAVSEWLQRKSTTKISAMYFSAGYRVNRYTPYVIYSQNSPGSFLPGFPPPSPNSIRLAGRVQNSTSLGVRWDFMKDADLKFQYDRVQLSGDSDGFIANIPTGVTLYGNRFHVVSAVFDFVF